MFVPLFADDISTLISAIVVIVGFLGWIFNLVSGKNQPQQPPRRPRREEVRDDIFIQEEPVRRPAPRGKKSKPAAPAAPEARSSARRPVGGIASRHIQTSDLGAGVRSHVTEIQSQKVGTQSIAGRVEQSVAEHLGTFSVPETQSRPTQQAAQQIVQMLRNPASVQQAIIVTTVLSRPTKRR